MSAVRRSLIPPVLLVALAGCTASNPLFCERQTQCSGGLLCDATKKECVSPDEFVPQCSTSTECNDSQEPICDNDLFFCRACNDSGGNSECASKNEMTPICSSGTCVACNASLDCGEAAPICTSNGACARCELGVVGNAACAARDTATPMCDGKGRCVECVDDSDCASTLCDPTRGECIDEASVVFAAPDGANGETCGTPDMPCASIGGDKGALDKVTATRRFIRLTAGSYRANVVLDKDVTIVGENADIRGDVDGQPVLSIRDGAAVVVRGLRLREASGTGDGILCDVENAASITLLNAVVEKHGGWGVMADKCQVEIRNSSIVGNGKGGIEVRNGALVLNRSRVRENRATGVTIASSEVDINNNFIVANGSTATRFGGIDLDNGADSIPARLSFNTITANVSQDDEFGVIVSCFSNTIEARGNIVHGNVNGDPVYGTCPFVFSDIQGGAEGEGNIDADPKFVDKVAGNYHLAAGSPCINAAGTAGDAALDIDGDLRPQDAAFDVGADEFVSP